MTTTPCLTGLDDVWHVSINCLIWSYIFQILKVNDCTHLYDHRTDGPFHDPRSSKSVGAMTVGCVDSPPLQSKGRKHNWLLGCCVVLVQQSIPSPPRLLVTLQVLLFTPLGWLEEVGPFVSTSLSDLPSFVQVEGVLVVPCYLDLLRQTQVAISLPQFVCWRMCENGPLNVRLGSQFLIPHVGGQGCGVLLALVSE